MRVANDFKTEAQHDVERLLVENKQLIDKNTNLTAELEALKVRKSLVLNKGL